ncbi:hypothetical protein LXL04_028638 [Taraxacum kok-saghyz]
MIRAATPKSTGSRTVEVTTKAQGTLTTKTPFKGMSDKRAKGLCFCCDGKYGHGHQCLDKTLHDLLSGDEEEDKELVHLDMISVSASSVMGVTTPQTIKLRGEIAGQEVIVLIDCGAMHNFESVHLVGPLGLSVTGKCATMVMMGNGKFELTFGVCKGVKLTLPGVQLNSDFYPLELGSTYIIMSMHGYALSNTLGSTGEPEQ